MLYHFAASARRISKQRKISAFCNFFTSWMDTNEWMETLKTGDWNVNSGEKCHNLFFSLVISCRKLFTKCDICLIIEIILKFINSEGNRISVEKRFSRNNNWKLIWINHTKRLFCNISIAALCALNYPSLFKSRVSHNSYFSKKNRLTKKITRKMYFECSKLPTVIMSQLKLEIKQKRSLLHFSNMD